MDLENSLIVVASFSNSSHLTDSKLLCIRTFDSKCEQRDSESSSRNFSLSISSSRSSSCKRINGPIRSLAGAHHLKPATTPNSGHGVFTDRSIFSLNLSRIQIPTGTSLTNCSHKHGLMLTCSCRHVNARSHCFILTEACSCRLELGYFAGKISKNRLVCKKPLHWLIMGVAGS